jgi:hypothetical protein
VDYPDMSFRESHPFNWDAGVEWFNSGNREVPWPYSDTGADAATNQGFLWAYHYHRYNWEADEKGVLWVCTGDHEKSAGCHWEKASRTDIRCRPRTSEATHSRGVEKRMTKAPVLGDTVIFHDPIGTPHPALVTAVWGPTCINVVFVSGDDQKRDSYGRQIERATSIPHKDSTSVHGFYFRFEDEEPRPYVAPQQV